GGARSGWCPATWGPSSARAAQAPPNAKALPTVSARAAASHAAATTCAPASAKPIAIAWPRPREAPVTTAICPSREKLGRRMCHAYTNWCRERTGDEGAHVLPIGGCSLSLRQTSRPAPLYEQVKRYVLDRVTRGEWADGTRLPSEQELVESLGVSRMTVHRALRELSAEGLVSRIQGVGT